MTGIGLRIAAVAIGLSFAALPTRPAAAAEFVDQCVEGMGGMLTEEECTCLDDNLEDDDRDDIAAMLKAARKNKKDGTEFPDDSPILKKGFAAMNKYEKKCSKK